MSEVERNSSSIKYLCRCGTIVIFEEVDAKLEVVACPSCSSRYRLMGILRDDDPDI